MSKSIFIAKDDNGGFSIHVPKELVEEFALMVKRATNTWQGISRPMTDFAAKVNDNYELVKTVYHPRPICDGHPETCNCPKHCR